MKPVFKRSPRLCQGLFMALFMELSMGLSRSLSRALSQGLSLALLPAVLLLSGCGFSSQPEAALPAAPSPVREFIIQHQPGAADSVGTVSDPEFGENLRIVLEQEFLSASGQNCRRASLFSAHGEAEVVIMCRAADGAWIMAPRVWGRGLSGQRQAQEQGPEPGRQ